MFFDPTIIFLAKNRCILTTQHGFFIGDLIILLQGLTAEIQHDSLGCYIYDGSILDDLYPVYVNKFGQFLTPDYFR